MNVVCGECSTEYEFDDALVSERGTTVRCTNCGHQFRVMPSRPSHRVTPERWLIRKASGEAQEFASLGDLQRAIAKGTVTIDDRISKDGQPFRPLRDVAELVPFFSQEAEKAQQQRPGTTPGVGQPRMGRPKGTLIGLSAQQAGLVPPPIESPKSDPLLETLASASSLDAPPPPKPAPAQKRGPVESIKPQVIEGPAVATKPVQEPRRTPLGGLTPDKPQPPVEIPPSSSVPVEAQRIAPVVAETESADDLQALLDPAIAEKLSASRLPKAEPQMDVAPETQPIQLSADTLLAADHARDGVEANAEQLPEQPAPEPTLPEATPPPPKPNDVAAGEARGAMAQTQASPKPQAMPTTEEARIPLKRVTVDPPSSPIHAIPRRPRRRDDDGTMVSASDGASPGSSPESRPPRSSMPAPLSVPPPAKSAAGMRWVVALVLVGGLVLLATTVGRDYMSQFVSSEPSATSGNAKGNEKVGQLLDSAREHLAKGDLEAAKAEYDKASVLAENHPGVALGLATIEAVRADRLWLKLQILPAEPVSAREAAANELRVRLTKLQAALKKAEAVAPDDPQLQQLQIDALRADGKVEEARQHAGGLTSRSSDPATAYVLAALDAADAAPSWPTVLQRLQTAMSADRGLGRAHALLIYALTKSGDVERAKAELEKMNAGEFPHPLAQALAAFVGGQTDEQSEAEPSASASAAEPAQSADAAEGADDDGPSDFRHALEQASKARRAGDLARAEQLYNVALQQQPGNVEALSGLGTLAKRQGRNMEAQRLFTQALDKNPGYLPALIGSADLKWAAGDRAAAVKLYRRVGPGNMYSERAQQRIAQFGGGSDSSPEPAPERPSAPKPPVQEYPSDKPAADHNQPDVSDLPEYQDNSKPATPPSQPHIDTSDLPGH